MNKIYLAIAVVLSFTTLGAAKGKTVVEHPSKLTYDTLKWEIPTGTPYRTVLKNGLRAYVAVDSILPMVRLIGYVRYGTLNDPASKYGVSPIAASLLRTGGTEKYPADTLDVLLDEYAIKIGFTQTETALTFSASFLSDYTDTALNFLEQMIYHPVFDKKKLDKEVKITRESIRHRFDNPGPTLDVAYQKVMYPAEASSRLITEQTLSQITRKDCIDLHNKIFKTGNIIVGVAGKFDRTKMISRLETMFPSSDSSKTDTTFPAITIAPKVKCLVIHKPITQAYVRIGLPMFKRPHPDYYPMSLLNMVLGGGGFTSRLGTKVRSDEGLTYSIYSNAESNYMYPATFYIEYYTKNESFNRATSLTLSETAKLRAEGITDKELSDAKNVLVGELPSMFRTPFDIVSTYAWNEYYGRPQDHFVTYPAKLAAIKREEVLAVAKKYLDPAQMTYTIVGDTSALSKAPSAEGFSLSSLTPKKTVSADSIPFLP